MAFQSETRRALVDILGDQWVKDDPVTLYSYRCDGLTLRTALPMGVIFPRSHSAGAFIGKYSCVMPSNDRVLHELVPLLYPVDRVSGCPGSPNLVVGY